MLEPPPRGATGSRKRPQSTHSTQRSPGQVRSEAARRRSCLLSVCCLCVLLLLCVEGVKGHRGGGTLFLQRIDSQMVHISGCVVEIKPLSAVVLKRRHCYCFYWAGLAETDHIRRT